MKAFRPQTLFRFVLLFLLWITLLTGCAQAQSTQEAATEVPVATEAPAETEVSAATEAPVATFSQPTTEISAATETGTDVVSPNASSTPMTPAIENELRVVELEWPANIRYGDSDLIRLSLVPSEDGYTVVADYQEHQLTNQPVNIIQRQGYTLNAVGRLDGVGFDISPSGNQIMIVNEGETLTWRWSISPRKVGQQRLSVVLLLQWVPDDSTIAKTQENVVFTQNLDIRVISIFGLSKSTATSIGFLTLAFSCILGVWSFTGRQRMKRKRLVLTSPDERLSVETGSDIKLNKDELGLFKAAFKKYARILIKSEFLSGYSGARSFLVKPVAADGLADAETIIKIGPCNDIETEFNHYEEFVKDRLPPITARIQHAPIRLAEGDRAALQYTCISEPGRSPLSLRQALLQNPNEPYIQRLFDAFGPNWWMQRKPHTFRLAEEYDRLLPPHFVLEPAAGTPRAVLDLHANLDHIHLQAGDLVSVSGFLHTEIRADGKSHTLYSEPKSGEPALRYRWLSPLAPKNSIARVVSTRQDLLLEITRDFELGGFSDPLQRLNEWLEETINGTRSVIHGDLNLENILLGPGNLVWLIDFALTREGHPLFDFSHLAGECIAHVISQQELSSQQFLHLLKSGQEPLLAAIERISTVCLFNPSQPREYWLALTLSCLGGLKYQNVSSRGKQLLYLAAAYYGSIC